MVYTAKDYDRALLAPEEVFESPMDVVNTDSLTPEQKTESSPALGSQCARLAGGRRGKHDRPGAFASRRSEVRNQQIVRNGGNKRKQRRDLSPFWCDDRSAYGPPSARRQLGRASPFAMFG
jgi:hypothetical protein